VQGANPQQGRFNVQETQDMSSYKVQAARKRLHPSRLLGPASL
jgi:hypothetical protein